MAGSGCVGEGVDPLAVGTGIPEDPFSLKAGRANWLAASHRQLPRESHWRHSRAKWHPLGSQTPNDRRSPQGAAAAAGLAGRKAMSAKADNKKIGYNTKGKYFEKNFEKN